MGRNENILFLSSVEILNRHLVACFYTYMMRCRFVCVCVGRRLTSSSSWMLGKTHRQEVSVFWGMCCRLSLVLPFYCSLLSIQTVLCCCSFHHIHCRVVGLSPSLYLILRHDPHFNLQTQPNAGKSHIRNSIV